LVLLFKAFALAESGFEKGGHKSRLSDRDQSYQF
jgi:hypothetical protein